MNREDELKLLAEAKEDIIAKTRASFFILLQACADISMSKLMIPDPFKHYCHTVFSTIAELDAPADGKAVISLKELLTNAREEIQQAFKNIGILKNYQLLIRDSVIRVFSQFTEKDEIAPEEGIDVFNAHLGTLTVPGSEDGQFEVDTRHISECMSYIPLRMTAARYRDYVSDAFKCMQMRPQAESAEIYKRVFYPMGYPVDNGYTDDTWRELNELWEEDVTLYDEAACEAALDKLKTIYEYMVKLTMGLTELYDAVNALYIVIHFNKSNFLANDEEALTMLGIFKRLEKEGGWENAGDFDTQVNDALEESMGDTRIGPANLAALGAPMDLSVSNEEDRQNLREWEEIDGLFFETGIEYLDSHKLDRYHLADDAEPFLAEFLPYLEECAAHLNGRRKRMLRQHFLRQIPYPYELENYRQYFTEVYAELNNADRNLLIARLDDISGRESIFDDDDGDDDDGDDF
jgi:hypothetical protein